MTNWKTIKTETVLDNDFFTISKDECEMASGSKVDAYYSIKRPDVIVIGAFTDENKLILIHQYRHPVKSADFEVPAGYIDEGENPEKAAARELLEETGYECEKIEALKEVFSSSGLMNNSIHFFIGLHAKKVGKQNLDKNEEISVHETSWDEILVMFDEGKIKDMASAHAILLFKDFFDERP